MIKKMATVDNKKRMIDIADFMFANPDTSRADILAIFGKKWQLSRRTLDRTIREAKGLNRERLRQQESIRAQIVAKSTEENVNSAILTRFEAMTILAEIGRGIPRVVKNDKGDPVEMVVPSDSDRVRALSQLSKIEGWEHANIDITTNGDSLTQSPTAITAIFNGEKVEFTADDLRAE